MRLIRGYIATSLDGYIADPDGGFDFLAPYPAEGPIYDQFIANIGTIVMGRGTYEAVARHSDWPYGDQRSIVVSTRDLGALPVGVEQWRTGEVDGLIGMLHGPDLPPGDVWVLGGGQLQQAFIDRGEIDRLQLFIVPEILGAGIPMIPPGARRGRLKLADVTRWDEIACLTYERC